MRTATKLAACLFFALSISLITEDAFAQIDPVVSRYDSSDQTGIIRLSGHTDYHWYLQVYSGTGRLNLWVNGFPIGGSYWDYGPYRLVALDLFGAVFVYHIDLSRLNSRGPSAVIDWFVDDYGNFITPGHNVLWEAI